MAWRIGDYVVGGELIHSRRNSVLGWLDFGNDCGIRFELTGNLSGDLEGRHLRFTVTRQASDNSAESRELQHLEMLQIGVVGTVVLRVIRVPRVSAAEFYERCRRGESPPTDEKPCLYLEWYSQNGRVVAEIVDPHIEYVSATDENLPPVEPEPLPDQTGNQGLAVSGYQIDADGQVHEFELTSGDEDRTDDPYKLFPENFDALLTASSQNETADEDSLEGATSAAKLGKRSWEEVIPGIDPETKLMYEQWDEMVDGTKDVPLCTLFDPPIRLPPAEQLTDRGVAEMLDALLIRLAMHRVALDMCEHYSPRDAYRYLVEEILPEANIYPKISQTGFIQHYSTWEKCSQCDADFEARYEARKKANPDSDADGSA